MEGFSFAHSKNGIQTLMLELPMIMNGCQSVSCVVQYVIFPPHSAAGSADSNLSTWSEEDESTVSSFDKASEDETVQIITEVWVEPQDGVVVREGTLDPNYLKIPVS